MRRTFRVDPAPYLIIERINWARFELCAWYERRDMRLHQNLTMIEVGDSKLLDTIIAAGSMGQWIVDRPTPEILFVDVEHADDVLAIIRRSGHRPRVIDR